MGCNSITLCVGVSIKVDKCDWYTVERKTSNFSNTVSGTAIDCPYYSLPYSNNLYSQGVSGIDFRPTFDYEKLDRQIQYYLELCFSELLHL